jgi:hypothetical protein
MSSQTASFSNTIGWVHQSPSSKGEPSPGVREITSSAPTLNRISLRA